MQVPSKKPATAPVVAESRGFWDQVEAAASVVREYGLQIAALVGVAAFGVCLWVNVAVAVFLLLGTVMLVLASIFCQGRPLVAATPVHPVLTSGLPRQVPIGPGWSSRRPPHPGRNPFPPPAPPRNPQA